MIYIFPIFKNNSKTIYVFFAKNLYLKRSDLILCHVGTFSCPEGAIRKQTIFFQILTNRKFIDPKGEKPLRSVQQAEGEFLHRQKVFSPLSLSSCQVATRFTWRGKKSFEQSWAQIWMNVGHHQRKSKYIATRVWGKKSGVNSIKEV